MIKLLKKNIYSVLVIVFALVALSFHIFQLLSFFFSYTDFKNDKSFLYKLFYSSDSEEVTRVIFLGDVMLGRNVEYLSQLRGVSYSTTLIEGNLPEAHAIVANFESAISPSHFRTRAYTTQFSTAVWMLPVLTTLKVTHASLANNHSLDFGTIGYQNAIKEINNIGIKTFGHYSQVNSASATIIDGPQKIGLIGINRIFVTPNQAELKSQIEAMKEKSDIQVAYIHWGNEYELVHDNSQQSFATSLIEMGIDVIVGHHPHVVQDIGIIDGSLVFYSLGNFIFDQYFSKDVQEGYALAMTVSGGGELEFSIIPVTSIDSRSQPRLMTPIESEEFLKSISERSSASLQEQILQNKLSGLANLAEVSEMSMITQ